jgi:hypothetical protein
MGASNAMAAYTLYAGTLQPKPMHLLTWMALVSLDSDAEPWWSQGHEVLARMPLGRPEPITPADLRAVERHITPLFEAGAITVARHSSGHPGGVHHVRYRLWLRHPAPDENRRAEHRAAPVENRRARRGPTATENPPAPVENRRVPTDGTRRKVVSHPSENGAAPVENRRAKEYEDYEERIKNQEHPLLSSDSVPVRAREAGDDNTEVDSSASAEPDGLAIRQCEFDGCPVPDVKLPNDSRYHIGCAALARRAERAQAEAATP